MRDGVLIARQGQRMMISTAHTVSEYLGVSQTIGERERVVAQNVSSPCVCLLLGE